MKLPAEPETRNTKLLMDLKAAILKEHSKAQCDKIVRYIGSDNKLHELKTIIEERWEHETAAFRSRAKKILKLPALFAADKTP